MRGETLKPIDIRPADLETVRRVLREYVPELEVWAFGSRVSWTARDASDLDIALLTSKPLDALRLAEMRESFSLSDLPFGVDIVDWASVSENFQNVIKRNYTVVHGGSRQILTTTHRRQNLPFSEAVMINPTTRLKHGMIYPFVGMASVDADLKHTHPIEERVFTGGGSRFQNGDTLMARITPSLENGKITRYEGSESKSKAHGSTEFIVIRGRPKVTDNNFAYYLTRWENVRNYAVGQMTGTSGRQRVPTSSLDHLVVPLPPLPEQRAIARILSALDEKIELNRQMNKTLEEMARTLFKSWFVDFDPVRAKMDGRWRRGEPLSGLPSHLYDLFPCCLADLELGSVPEGWGIGVLDDAVELLSGGTPKTSVAEYWNGNIPWYTAKDAPSMSSIFVLDTERTITQAGLESSSAKILPAGTTIITARGTVGRLACLGIPMAMNQTCYGIRGIQGYSNFFTYWNVRLVVDQLQSRTHGTIFDTITRQTFKTVEIVLPPTALSDAFESVVRPIMEHMLNNVREAYTLSSQRDELLPKLLSGKLQTFPLPHKGSMAK